MRILDYICVTALLAACGDGKGDDETSSITHITGVPEIPTSPTTTDSEPTGAGEATAADTGDTDDTGGGKCSADEDCPPGRQCASFSEVCVPVGGCEVNEDCEPGLQCVAGSCEIGGCGAESFDLTAVPPNVMIVLDRSGSMDGDVQDSDKTRWEVAKDAIGLLVDGFNDEIRFGLATYSSCTPGEGCSAGSIVVPLGNQAAGPITGFLADKDLDYLCNSGDPETSTGNTLYALLGEPTLQDPQRANAVLLLTDGGENSECQQDTNGADAAAALLAQTLPVKTFAVGFSDEVIDSLVGIAQAGGTDQPFNANNPASLEAALTAIAGAVASCQFLLDSVPDDPTKIYVFFDDDPAGVPLDATDGWTYDPLTNTITFHGSACAAIQGITVTDVDVVFGCNVPVPG